MYKGRYFLNVNHDDNNVSGLNDFLEGLNNVDNLLLEGPKIECFIEAVNNYVNGVISRNFFDSLMKDNNFFPRNSFIKIIDYARDSKTKVILLGQENDEIFSSLRDYLVNNSVDKAVVLIGEFHKTILNYV